MGVKESLYDLAMLSMSKTKGLTAGKVMTNVVKSKNARIDVSPHPVNKNMSITKVHANREATDQGIKKFMKSGNKGSGGHKGTHSPSTPSYATPASASNRQLTWLLSTSPFQINRINARERCPIGSRG